LTLEILGTYVIQGFLSSFSTPLCHALRSATVAIEQCKLKRIFAFFRENPGWKGLPGDCAGDEPPLGKLPGQSSGRLKWEFENLVDF
jgi:hypothetical protein